MIVDNRLGVVIGICFLVSVFGMFFLNRYVRLNRRLFRLGHSFSALSGMAAAILLASTEDDRKKMTVFIIFVLIVGISVFLYNLVFLIKGEGDILTSTLVNCTVNTIRGGWHLHRVSYRVEGTSLEGNKNSFLLQYPEDKSAVTMGPITPNTQIIVQYYSNSYSIYRVYRNF
ncbi:MAG: hypothetical protein J5802_03840 [Butyrivibrio sp.]|nr:hypothetical protein [Butyrivibrio sp.]